MTSYLIRRVLLIVPTLIGITIIVFFFMSMTPGGINAVLLSKDANMDPKVRAAMQEYIRKRYRTDRPAYERYFHWVNKVSPVGFREGADGTPGAGGFGVKAPDLGESFIKRRPVLDIVAEALPVTLLLNAVSMPIIYALSVWSGIRAAAHRGKLFDTASGTFFLALWSFPVILAGVMGIGFLANEQYVRWFPTNGLHDIFASDMRFLPSWNADGFQRGYLLDTAWHLVLPVICLSYGSFAVLSKLTRGSTLDNVQADYARTARAKGLTDRDTLYRHVLRNSLLPLITYSSSVLPAMLSGSVVVESIFGIHGMGKLAVDAVVLKDPEVVMSLTLISGLLGLIGYLLADIGYALADPRVSYDR